MEVHKEQLERVRWETALNKDGDKPYDAASHGEMFWNGVKQMKRLKKLEMAVYPGSPVPGQSLGTDSETVWGARMTKHIVESEGFMLGVKDWDPQGLEEFKIRFSIIAAVPQLEKKILEELEKAKYLKTLEITYGIPSFFDPKASSEEEEGKTKFHCWYYDVEMMTTVINSLPTSLETLIIDFDGKHDIFDAYGQYEFGPLEDTMDRWDEDGSLRAQIKDIVNQRRAIPRKLLYDRMPNLKKVYIGGYDIVDVVVGMAGLSLEHE